MATPRRIRKLFEHLGPCSTTERAPSANSPALQVGAVGAEPAAAEGAEKRPNLLYIISDQHNPFVTGCYGDEIVSTPHLDSLAARGVTLDHCCKDSPPHPATRHHPLCLSLWRLRGRLRLADLHAGADVDADGPTPVPERMLDQQRPVSVDTSLSVATSRQPSAPVRLDSGTPTFAHACGAAGYNPVLVGRMHSNGPDQLCASSAIRRLAGLEA